MDSSKIQAAITQVKDKFAPQLGDKNSGLLCMLTRAIHSALGCEQILQSRVEPGLKLYTCKQLMLPMAELLNQIATMLVVDESRLHEGATPEELEALAKEASDIVAEALSMYTEAIGATIAEERLKIITPQGGVQ